MTSFPPAGPAVSSAGTGGVAWWQALGAALAWAAVSVWTLFWTALSALLFLVHPLVDPHRRGTHRLAGVWGRGIIRMAGGRVRLFGRQNLPAGRPVVFLANHQSYADVPTLFYIRRPFKWMADEALFRIPFFGWAMRMAGYLPVERGSPQSALRALEQAKELLGQRISIFLFPEGTRSHTGAFGRFQTGGFRLAAMTGVPVVPVVVVGTRQFLPWGQWLFRPNALLQIHILPPLTVTASASRSVREVHGIARRVRAQMEQVYRSHLREICPPGKGRRA